MTESGRLGAAALEWLDGHADHALSFHRGWGPDEDFPEPEPAAFSCASCEKEYVLAALPPSAPPALDVERLALSFFNTRQRVGNNDTTWDDLTTEWQQDEIDHTRNALAEYARLQEPER